MTIAIRPADLEADAGQMIKLLAAHVNPRYDHARFEWLYRQNPDGLARAWVAVDTSTGELVGTAAAVPRRLQILGRPELAWVLSDFCIADPYRTLGPALQLQRACLAPVISGEVPLCYDFPSGTMMAVYRRLRIPPLGQMRRLVHPLRVDRKLEALPVPALIRRGLAGAGNLALDLRRSRRRADRGLQWSHHRGGFDSAFTAVARDCSGDHPICIHRSADYLNWRFLANPFQRHEILTVRQDGRLVAYAIVAPDRENPMLVDLFGPADRGVMSTLVAAALTFARDLGAFTLSAGLLESHPWVRLLGELGFHPREAYPVVLCPAPTRTWALDPTHPAPWLLTYGDRDS